MAYMNMMMGMPPPMMSMRCTHSTVTAAPFDESFAFTCNGCQEMGYGACFQCSYGCDFHLHEECLFTEPVVYHFLFGQRPFYIQSRSHGTNYLCSACGMSAVGLRYYHTHPGGSIFLHPCCVNLPDTIETDDGDVLFLKKTLGCTECVYCESTGMPGAISGWAYVSDDEELACHVRCMKQKMYEDWSMYAQLDDLDGPWWLTPYGGPNYDDSNSLVPWVGPRDCCTPVVRPTASSSSSSSTRPPAQGQSSLALTTRPQPTSKPTGRKRRMFWKLSKAAAKLLFGVATSGGEPISTAVSALSAIQTVHELL